MTLITVIKDQLCNPCNKNLCFIKQKQVLNCTVHNLGKQPLGSYFGMFLIGGDLLSRKLEFTYVFIVCSKGEKQDFLIMVLNFLRDLCLVGFTRYIVLIFDKFEILFAPPKDVIPVRICGRKSKVIDIHNL